MHLCVLTIPAKPMCNYLPYRVQVGEKHILLKDPANTLSSYPSNATQVAIWTSMGEKQANLIRAKYLQSILRQDATYFDTQASASGKLLTSIESDTYIVQEAMGEKLGQFLHNLAAFLIGIGVALERGWELTLVILGVMPLILIFGGLSAKQTSQMVLQVGICLLWEAKLADMGVVFNLICMGGVSN